MLLDTGLSTLAANLPKVPAVAPLRILLQLYFEGGFSAWSGKNPKAYVIILAFMSRLRTMCCCTATPDLMDVNETVL